MADKSGEVQQFQSKILEKVVKESQRPSWIKEQQRIHGPAYASGALKDSFKHGAGVQGQIVAEGNLDRTNLLEKAAKSGTVAPAIKAGAGTTESLQGAQKKLDKPGIEYVREVEASKS